MFLIISNARVQYFNFIYIWQKGIDLVLNRGIFKNTAFCGFDIVFFWFSKAIDDQTNTLVIVGVQCMTKKSCLTLYSASLFKNGYTRYCMFRHPLEYYWCLLFVWYQHFTNWYPIYPWWSRPCNCRSGARGSSTPWRSQTRRRPRSWSSLCPQASRYTLC